MEIRLARAGCACLVAALSVVSTIAHAAQELELQGPLTLAQALDAALSANPELAASRYELTAAQARVVQASKKRNPEVSIELENFAGGGTYRDVDSLETTMAFSQVVELGGKRDLRRSIAEMDSETVAMELRGRQLDLLADVTRKYIDVVAAQEKLGFATEHTMLAERTQQAIAARVKSGRSPVAEESRALIDLTRAQIEQRQAAIALETARGALALSWGRIDPQFSRATADLFEFEPIDSFESLSARIERTPDILRFASEARMRDAELRLARVQTRPNVVFSLGVRRFEESSDAALVAGFSMPLAIYDRNQGAIVEARARRAQVDANRVASKSQTLATLFALYREAYAAKDRATALRDRAIPQAREALAQTRSGYERGRFSFLELQSAQQDLLAVSEATIEAAADYHRLVAEVERLTSEPLTTQNPGAPLP